MPLSGNMGGHIGQLNGSRGDRRTGCITNHADKTADNNAAVRTVYEQLGSGAASPAAYDNARVAWDGPGLLHQTRARAISRL